MNAYQWPRHPAPGRITIHSRYAKEARRLRPHLATGCRASQYVAMVIGTPLLKATGIGRRADSRRWLLQDVDICVQAGEQVALVGPSGAGKTLLLRTLACLDPRDTGEIYWRGSVVSRHQIPEYRRRVIYVSQRPSMLAGTVEENLRLPYSLAVHRDRTFDEPRVREWLGRLGRPESFLATDSHHLSGGEAQITALVRAIQLDPDILLLDEPTASLDRAAALVAEKIIDDWIRDEPQDRAAIWTSHDPEQTDRVASRRVKMTAGGKVDHTDD